MPFSRSFLRRSTLANRTAALRTNRRAFLVCSANAGAQDRPPRCRSDSLHPVAGRGMAIEGNAEKWRHWIKQIQHAASEAASTA